MGKRDDNGPLFSKSMEPSLVGFARGVGALPLQIRPWAAFSFRIAARVIPTPSSDFERSVPAVRASSPPFQLAWESPGSCPSARSWPASEWLTTIPPSRSPQPSRLLRVCSTIGWAHQWHGFRVGASFRAYIARPRPPYHLPFPRSHGGFPRVCSIIEWFQHWDACSVGASFPASSSLGSPPQKKRPHLTGPPASSPASASTQLPFLLFHPQLLPQPGPCKALSTDAPFPKHQEPRYASFPTITSAYS